MDLQHALDFIASQHWTFARTRPRNPHYYVLRGRGNEPVEFDEMVRFVRRFGVRRVWGNKLYHVWYAPDGHHYWTMGWPIGECDVLNRAHTATADQTTLPVSDRAYQWMGPREANGAEPTF